MNKCEWKDGEFFKCIEARKHMHAVYSGPAFSFCPFCGADIRKPKLGKQDPDNWSKEKWIAFYHAVKPFMGEVTQ